MRYSVFVADTEIGWFDIIPKVPAETEGITGIQFICGKSIASCDNEQDAEDLAMAYNAYFGLLAGKGSCWE